MTNQNPVGRGLAGSRAVVTGGAHGIGAAIVAQLALAGTEVVVLDQDGPADGIETVLVDLADSRAVAEAAGHAVRALDGNCEILVNCAGVCGPVAHLRDLDLDQYHRVLAVNLHAPVLLMKMLGLRMADAGYGRIVNVTSVHGRLSEPGALAYDVSKAGLEAATRTAAIELAAAGVLVNAVAPGFVMTRMSVVDGRSELESEWFKLVYVKGGRLPVGRPASPSEIAESVQWLCSAANSYTTGQVLTVDGGLSARF